MALTNDELAQNVKQLLNNCVGYAGDELDANRQQAYDYYFQRARGDEVTGRSSIVTGDLSAMVEGNLALMVEPLTGKRIAEFCAYDALDEEQAQLESDCVSEMLFKRQNGFIETTVAIKDALLLRNAVVKVYVDTRTYKQTVRKSNVDPEVVTELLDQIGDVKVHTFDPDKKKLSATVTKTTRTFRVEALAPENLLFPKSWHRADLEGIPFVAERHVETRSTLVERGFKRSDVDGLQRWGGPTGSTADARLPKSVSTAGFSAVVDKGQELVEWYECYVRITDADGTGELRCVSIGGNTLLENEPADSLCYATGVVIINPHTIIGISLHDKLKSTQDSTTAMTRALMDNLNATNKSRTAHIEGRVDIDALQDGRINNSVGVDPEGGITDVRQAIMALQVPDTSANILQNLQHMSRIRAEMGGATLDMSTGQMQLNDRLGSQGLDRAYSVMEQLAAFMTRMVANTLMRQMYLVAHETLRTQWIEPIQWKRGKEWLITQPSQWKKREAISINLGASSGERARLSAVYMALMTKQETLAAQGMEGILVDAQSYYIAFINWLRINDVPNPENYILDPRTPASTDAMKRKAMQQQMAQQKQDNMVNSAIALEQLRTAVTKYVHDSQLQFDYFNAVLNAEVEEAKLTTNAVVDITKTKLTASQAKAKAETSDGDSKPGTEKESSTGTAGEPAAL